MELIQDKTSKHVQETTWLKTHPSTSPRVPLSGQPMISGNSNPIMTTQDENTGFKPASAITPDPPVLDAFADITDLDKPSEDGDDSNLSLSKSKSTPSTGDDAVVELPPTAEPSIEGHGGATEALPPSKSNSVVDGKDDAIVEPLLTTEPPAMKLDGEDAALSTVATNDGAIVEMLLATEPQAMKLDGDDDALLAMATEDDVIVEPLLTTEPSVTKLDGDDDIRPLSKSNSAVATKDDDIVEPLLTTEPPALKLDGDSHILPPSKSNSAVAAKDDVVVKPLLTTEPLAMKHDRDNDTRLPNKKSKLLDQQNGDEDCKLPSATKLKPPMVKALKDFFICNEVDEFDDADECVSTYTLIMAVDQGSFEAWIGTVNAPRAQISLEQAMNCLSRIPDKAIYPPVPPGMQVVATSDFKLDNETWLKRPLIHAYSEKDLTNWTADAFLDEIKAHQLVEEHPHRNLVKFKGCLEKDGLVVGILQKRYRKTLNFRVKARSQPPYSATAFYDDIEAGLKHLHSLGFAHNDLNPNNVMVDAEDRPIIIDLGAAMPLGQHLHQGGTPGWCAGFQMTSCVANDEIGLRLMKEYLQEYQKKK
ncbi:hypothetical protein LCI18_014666 [Fusarium solani-melongenae]|uniref:Uncharacterized protein n=1 Tax=Fusarium solani subsp. cucurbitae TaxID=2747967 RepID=A0ACD3ZSA6_FUSSC|nr:hypothetical protein LCI18_014666 [Fusarium solani-melongenae]